MTVELIPLGLFEGEIFSNVNFFLMIVITIAGIIGVASKFLSLGAYGAYMIFSFIAVETQITIFQNALYVLTAIILVVLGFQTWNISTQQGDI